MEGVAAEEPQEVTERLLAALPSQGALWSDLSNRYEVRLWFGISFTGWNRGFHISSDLCRRISSLHATISFDLYSYDTDDA
jgi:hypothetical protein